MTEKIPMKKDFEAARKLYSRLRLKINFPEKRWLMDARSYEDYLRRLEALGKRHGIPLTE